MSKKGPRHERNFAKRLSLWWTNGKRNDIFWRTSSSGARATVRAKQGLKTADSYGDIKAEHISGKPLTSQSIWSLKKGYSGKKGKKSLRWASILDILDHPPKTKASPAIVSWWRELLEIQHFTGKKNIFLVFKRDRKEEVIGMQQSTFQELENKNGQYQGTFILLRDKMTSIVLITTSGFFSWAKPETLGKQKQSRKIKRRRKTK